jgi:hypothetical protein
MRLLCWLGRHRYERKFSADRVDSLGRANPHFDRCRLCGHERDHPIAHWDRPDPPFVGG